MRNRACGVVIRNDHILLVRHVHNGRDYWTLPGGGIEENETHSAAAEREVREETGIRISAIRHLCTHTASTSISHCFLMQSPLPAIQAVLGTDPEQSHLPVEQRMLREVGWKNITEAPDNPLVQQALLALMPD